MKILTSPFQLDGCQCRLKLDPGELQTLLVEKLEKKFQKKSKFLDQQSGDLSIGGRFVEIDEGNFAMHFMLAFLGKAWIAGHIQVQHNGQILVDEPFRVSATCSCFTSGSPQLRYDIEVLANQIVKKTIKALKQSGV